MVARVLAACLVALAAGCAGGGGGKLTLPKGEPFAVSSSLTPRTVAFGDPLTARVRVLLDRDTIDPESVRLLARFSPWRDVMKVERVDSGNLTALIYTIELHCLTLACVVPEREYRAFFNGDTRVTTADGRVREILWPQVNVITRVPAQDSLPENTGDEEADNWPPRWRAAAAVPEASYRVPPPLLAWLLGGLGALLIAASAATGWRLWTRVRHGDGPEVSALDRALALLGSAGTDEERRAALEALALALERERDRELAKPARALAWSEPQPSETQAAELAELAQGKTR